MKRIFTNAAIIMLAMALCTISQTAEAQGYGIFFDELEVTEENASDIFGDGMASYDYENNTLTLQPGFDFHLSKGKVTIATGDVFTIFLKGHAEIYACVEVEDDLLFESPEADTLFINSNISGSALKCKSLSIPKDFCLSLYSRNSQENMYALDCEKALSVEGGCLLAEVTTAEIAVKTDELTMRGSYMLKPKGGGVNPLWGGICFADGTPAKTVKIVPFDYNEVNEHNTHIGNNVQKVFENGQIIIIKDGKRYNIAGQLID